MVIKRIFHVCYALALSSGLAYAEAPSYKLSEIDASKISAIRVVLTTPQLRSSKPITESSILDFGCLFEAKLNTKKNVELADAIRSSSIEKSNGETSIQPRNIVGIDLLDGSSYKILFGEFYRSPERVPAKVQHSKSNQTATYTFDKKFISDLRKWSTKEISTKNFSESCFGN